MQNSLNAKFIVTLDSKDDLVALSFFQHAWNPCKLWVPISIECNSKPITFTENKKYF